MRTLVLTNHFAEFAGSEIVALEVAQWFRAQGDQVTLGANYINDPIAGCADGITLTRDIEALELNDYDLVWCQHDLLAQLPLAAFERAAAQARLPYVALISLSPYDPYEHVDPLLARAMSAEIFANSPETAQMVLHSGHRRLAASRVRTFHNGAPAEFWVHPTAGEAGHPPLRSVTLVSNHPPQEVLDAMSCLERTGIATRRIGRHLDRRLVGPRDIADADAIISIGKTALYAIAQRKPTYIYDHFGGDGWLARDNFKSNLHHNFSGRPARRRLAAAAIVDEIMDGYSAAVREMGRIGEAIDLRLLSLDHHLTEFRQRAALRSDRAWRAALRLRLQLRRTEFRMHLETSYAKGAALKRSYLCALPAV